MKSNFRFGIAIFLVFLLALSFMGCGSSETSNSTPSVDDKKETASKSIRKEEKQATKFPEKDIEFVVGYKAGGGYSDWAQAVAPFIEKHLPNKVNVNVRYMEGAGSAIAANYVQKANPDGYTIKIYNLNGLAALQLVGKANFDLKTVTWLGRLASEVSVAVVNPKGPFKDIEDFKNKSDVIMSTKGLAANATTTGAVTFAKLNTKWKPLNHNGTSESVLSVIRGNGHILWGAYESLAQYIRSGDVKPVLYYDDTRHPDFPDVPTSKELGFPELNALNDQRLIGAPPGVPDDVRLILETALKKAIEDPDFQQVLKKMKKTSSYLNSKDTQKIVIDSSNTLVQYRDILTRLFEEK